MNLSANFTLYEMTLSETAVRRGIRNIPSDAHVDALRQLCVQVLQPLRNRLRQPVVITSGYRSPELNTAIKGSYRSQHCKGEAADFYVPGLSVEAVIDTMQSLHLPFDQLINEFGAWVHVSHRVKGFQRKEVLVARKHGQRTMYE